MKLSKILKVLVVSSVLLVTGGALAGCSDDNGFEDSSNSDTGHHEDSSKFDGLTNVNTVSKGVYKLASLPESNITGETAANDDDYPPKRNIFYRQGRKDQGILCK